MKLFTPEMLSIRLALLNAANHEYICVCQATEVLDLLANALSYATQHVL